MLFSKTYSSLLWCHQKFSFFILWKMQVMKILEYKKILQNTDIQKKKILTTLSITEFLFSIMCTDFFFTWAHNTLQSKRSVQQLRCRLSFSSRCTKFLPVSRKLSTVPFLFVSWELWMESKVHWKSLPPLWGNCKAWTQWSNWSFPSLITMLLWTPVPLRGLPGNL